MAGDAALFAREDYVEEAWRIVDPVLKVGTPVFEYELHQFIAIGFVAARLHNPIDNIKPVSDIAKAALLVQETSGCDPRHITLFANNRIESRRRDNNPLVVL